MARPIPDLNAAYSDFKSLGAEVYAYFDGDKYVKVSRLRNNTIRIDITDVREKK
jgi:hypothetical protein